VILRHRFATLVVTISTFVATVLLFIVFPRDFFPVQDTGVILGISKRRRR
jgi:multidrug efflux pump